MLAMTGRVPPDQAAKDDECAANQDQQENNVPCDPHPAHPGNGNLRRKPWSHVYQRLKNELYRDQRNHRGNHRRRLWFELISHRSELPKAYCIACWLSPRSFFITCWIRLLFPLRSTTTLAEGVGASLRSLRIENPRRRFSPESSMALKVFRINVPVGNLDGCGADMRSRLMTWEWVQGFKLETEEVVLDFRQNRFIEPWALAQYVAYALWVRKELQLPVRAETDAVNPANRYIQLMGIDQVLETGESTTAWDHSNQNTGLHVLRTHSDVQRFVQSAARLGSGPSSETVDALKYGMAELGRNVIQHAASPIGGVAMAQLFPDALAVQISISDRGQGLWESLRTNYPELRSDLEAAKLAVLPHASGAVTALGPYSSQENAGLGLFFCKEIAWRTGGSFWLASRTALLGVQGDDQGAQQRVYRNINPWDGTSVTMHFPANGQFDFAELLEICQNLARTARTSSGEAGLDFPDELPPNYAGETIFVGSFVENVEQAAAVRLAQLLPAVREGRWIVLDFTGVRFATQSFVHALLYEPLRVAGSLLRMSFLGCSKATREAIRTVAAYAASYRQLP